MRRTRRALPKDDGYGCGAAAVGLMIGLILVAVCLAWWGWEP